MLKDDLLYLGQMLDMARKAATKVQDIGREEYDADENLRLALAHLVQTIGEAARRVSTETSLEYPDIPWREIIGMRHKIVHDYMQVDEDIVWEVATQDLPPLIATLEKIVPPYETE
jgi:uncharacterized protein with HEPN domain